MSTSINQPVGSQAYKTQKQLSTTTSATEDVSLTNVQQMKRDALALAELIYDIFKDSLSSANIGANAISRKDKQNV